MAQDLAIFRFKREHAVRVTDKNGNPCFFARDVAKALRLKKPQNCLQKLDQDERGTLSTGTLGGPQEMVIVSEPGVYRLIASSRTEKAKEFQRWLYHEVLPEIRKTGGYRGGRIG